MTGGGAVEFELRLAEVAEQVRTTPAWLHAAYFAGNLLRKPVTPAADAGFPR